MGVDAMSGYTPQVGDRVRGGPGCPQYDVSAVGRHRFLAEVVNGDSDSPFSEVVLPINANWEKVETPEPLPESWIALIGSPDDPNYSYATKGGSSLEEAVDYAATVFHDAPLLAVVHVWTDEQPTDHAEIERVES